LIDSLFEKLQDQELLKNALRHNFENKMHQIAKAFSNDCLNWFKMVL